MTTTSSQQSAASAVKPAGQGDWFASAIFANGSVENCLDKVLQELTARRDFVAALRDKLKSKDSHIDSVSILALEVKTIVHTIRVRVHLLPPDRPGAWFRIPAVGTGGPFSSKLRAEPVFRRYPARMVQSLKQSIRQQWTAGALLNIPFAEEGNCLWQALLACNSRWNELNRLDVNGTTLELAGASLSLPEAIRSPLLEAFLRNVRLELDKVRQQLDQGFQQLWEGCERFWRWQAECPEPERPAPGADRNSDNTFRRPYESREARYLQILGFSSRPDPDELRKAYRRLAWQHHPDRTGCDGRRFLSINEAYQYLIGRQSSP